MAALTTSFMAVRSAPTFTGSKVAARAAPAAPVARRSVVVRAEEKAAPAPVEEKPWTAPTLDPNTPSPIFGGSTGGLLRKAQVEEFYVLTWEAKKESIFEMPVRHALSRADPAILLPSYPGRPERRRRAAACGVASGDAGQAALWLTAIGRSGCLGRSASAHNATRDLDHPSRAPPAGEGRASPAGRQGFGNGRIECVYQALSWRHDRPQLAGGPEGTVGFFRMRRGCGCGTARDRTSVPPIGAAWAVAPPATPTLAATTAGAAQQRIIFRGACPGLCGGVGHALFGWVWAAGGSPQPRSEPPLRPDGWNGRMEIQGRV
jgi:hypothetical protein